MPGSLEKLDCFCYVCGKHTLKEYKVLFFNSKVEEAFPDEPWVRKHICRNCYNGLMLWSKGERNSINFGISMHWLEPGEHDGTKCYVCQNSGIMKLNKHNRKGFLYKAVPSALLPVPHSDVLPVPAQPVRSLSLRWGAE